MGSSLEPNLIHVSSQWLVLDKPAGWLTIPPSPGAPGDHPVLSDWARAQFGAIEIVHRLDRETSGAILFARSADAHRQANQWFQAHQVRKLYDFLAVGRLSQPTLRIKSPVRGSPSVTQVEVKEAFSSTFLGRAMPLTGRRHQIRIHLASQGHSLLGDPEYGGARQIHLPNGALEIPRVALHSARLELPNGEVFMAPWPADFAHWVKELKNA